MNNGFRNMICLLTHGKCKEGWCDTPGSKRGQEFEDLLFEMLSPCNVPKGLGHTPSCTQQNTHGVQKEEETGALYPGDFLIKKYL